MYFISISLKNIVSDLCCYCTFILLLIKKIIIAVFFSLVVPEQIYMIIYKTTTTTKTKQNVFPTARGLQFNNIEVHVPDHNLLHAYMWKSDGLKKFMI